MPSSNIKRFARKLCAALSALALVAAQIPPAYADDESGGIIRDAEIEATLRSYADPIFLAAGLKPSEIHVYILEDRSLNAFVSGGQNMFLHTGLIMAAETPNQLKGVMAHETGHMAAGHLVRSHEGQSQAMVPALISIGLGVLAMAGGAPDAGATLIAGSQQFAISQFMTFTQTQESSADQAAVTYMDATHQSSEGLLDFFSNFREQELFSQDRREPLFRSHPLSSERIQALRERVDRSPYRDAKDSPEDIARFKMMQAKLFGYLEAAGRVYAKYPESDLSQPARYARAFAAYRIPDLQRATKETQELITIDGKNPYYQELMGQILFESGHWDQALPYDRKAVALSPDSVLLQVNLGRALSASPNEADLKEAVKVLQRATALEPDNPYAWSEMATAYGALKQEGMAELASAEMNFALGNYPLALNFAQRAKKGLPEGSTSWRRASDIALAAEPEVHGRGRS
jgi:predicted Zn-dependent protease